MVLQRRSRKISGPAVAFQKIAVRHVKKFRDEVNSFANMEDGWNGGNAEAPSSLAIHNARNALKSMVPMGWLVPDRAAPSAEGGVALSWRKGSRDAFIEFYNDGDILALTSDRSNKDRLIWDVSSNDVPSAIRRIVDFLYA